MSAVTDDGPVGGQARLGVIELREVGFMNQVWKRRVLGLGLVLTLAAGPSAAWGNEDAGLQNEAGIGALAALSSMVYGPAKLLYASFGLVFGGIAWGLAGGDEAVLTAVITPSVRGDYVVTPAHIRMERGLEFFGRDPAYRPVQNATFADAAFEEEDY